jgi:hypothetical protein
MGAWNTSRTTGDEEISSILVGSKGTQNAGGISTGNKPHTGSNPYALKHGRWQIYHEKALTSGSIAWLG